MSFPAPCKPSIPSTPAALPAAAVPAQAPTGQSPALYFNWCLDSSGSSRGAAHFRGAVVSSVLLFARWGLQRGRVGQRSREGFRQRGAACSTAAHPAPSIRWGSVVSPQTQSFVDA